MGVCVCVFFGWVGALKNNISLYISKSVRLERNQVSVQKLTPNRKGGESLQEFSHHQSFLSSSSLLSPS